MTNDTIEMQSVAYVLPSPVIDSKEANSIEKLNARYEKLCKPTLVGKAGKAVSKIVPGAVKNVAANLGNSISEQELYASVMNVIANSFKLIEETAAKYTIPREAIIKRVGKTVKSNSIKTAEEICLARGYDISRLVSNYKSGEIALAMAEGGATGAFGLVGLPFNLVLCFFICYRAVQTVAMFYGYDVKNDPDEMIIASEVYMNSMSPATANTNELSNTITKVMAFAEIQSVKEAVKKTYSEMVSRGGASLLIVQLRALAHKSAQKAIEEAGVKGLENSTFKTVFEQIGKRLTKDAVKKSIPGVSAVIGAAFDVAQMNTVLNYADVFYNKRFLLEKEKRISTLTCQSDVIFWDEEAEEKQ